MQTKEEILEANQTVYRNDRSCTTTTNVYGAMDAWAEQVAIGFAEWVANETWIYTCNLGGWYDASEREENKTTAELYQLYLSSLKEGK